MRFNLQQFAEGDELDTAPTEPTEPESNPLDDVQKVVNDLGERVAALETKIVEAPAVAVEHVAPTIEPTIEEPPVVLVDSTVERSGLRRLHDAIG